MLLYRFQSPPLQTNAILFAAAERGFAAVIDPGFGSTAPILQQAHEKKLKIEKILLTHSHWDHIADAHSLQKATGALLCVHSLDAQNVESPGSDGLTPFVPVLPSRVDVLLQDGDIMTIGALQIAVMHTPGHSQGSVCFYLNQESLLFSGDTLFLGCCGRIDLPTGKPEQMRASLKKLSKLPGETRVIPGHGPDTWIKNEPWMNKALA